MSFLPTLAPLARALAERDYTEPTPVQAAVLDDAAVGRDLLVSAQTGSGKTVAYGLAVADDILAGSERAAPPGPPLALVVAPTRELAMQVERELAWLYRYAGVRVVSCVGGMDPKRERRSLDEGVHVVVGTPGRLRDHLERGNLDVSALAAIVLDEADEMLDLGFREDLEYILDATPAERRTLLFSATLPKAIVGLAERYQHDALRIAVANREGGHADIEYRAVRVAANEVEHAVVNVLRQVEAPVAMIFLNTRNAVRHLHAVLVERGFAAVVLSGELGQSERNQALQALRDGRARVCVATDVAARGIDLPSLGLVIHVDLPQNPDILQHRSGRTGRAGRKGISVLIVPPSKRRRAEVLLSAARLQPTWSGPPTPEEIRRLDQERMLADPLLAEPAGEEDLAMARALIAERPAEEIAAALVRLFRARLPAPEEVFDPGPGREARAPRHERGGRTGAEAVGDDGGPRDRDDRSRGRFEGSSWFRIGAGRRDNADPRWILPLICRRGGITRAEVGAIRIFDGETRFEIAGEAAAGFAEALSRSEGVEPRIAPLGDDAGPPDVAVAPSRPVRADRPEARRPRPEARAERHEAPSRDSAPATAPRAAEAPRPGDAPAAAARPDAAPRPHHEPTPRPRSESSPRPRDESSPRSGARPKPERGLWKDTPPPRLYDEREAPRGKPAGKAAGKTAGKPAKAAGKGKSHQAKWRLERLEEQRSGDPRAARPDDRRGPRDGRPGEPGRPSNEFSSRGEPPRREASGFSADEPAARRPDRKPADARPSRHHPGVHKASGPAAAGTKASKPSRGGPADRPKPGRKPFRPKSGGRGGDGSTPQRRPRK